MLVKIQKPERHSKAWGWEDWIINNDKYCAKILHFHAGAKFSVHFHLIKRETWFVSKGTFTFKFIDTKTAQVHKSYLREGDVIDIPQGLPHQLISTSSGGAEIFEVSTQHFETDSYRIEPGDSQK